MKSASAITFDLRPSRLLVAALLIIAVLAAASVWLSELRRWPVVAILTCVAIAVLVAWTLPPLLRVRWLRAGWNAEGQWSLLDTHQTAMGAQLLDWSALGLSLRLRLRTTAAETVIVHLLPDNLDRDTRRRLRVRLTQETGRIASPPSSG
jgi:toxin CptA